MRWDRLSTIVLGLVVAAGCNGASGSESESPETTVPFEPTALCAYLQDAGSDAVIGEDATSTPPPTLGTPAPDEHCVLTDGDRNLSFAVFGNPDIYLELSVLVPESELIAGLGDSGVCGTSRGTSASGASCLFVRDGKTYVLGYTYPSGDDRDDEHAAVRDLAVRLDEGLRDAS